MLHWPWQLVHWPKVRAFLSPRVSHFVQGSNSRALAAKKYHEMSQNTRIRIYVSFLFSSSTSEEPLQMGKKKPKNTILASLIYSCRRKDSCFSPLKSSFLPQPSSKPRILQPKTPSSFGPSHN